MKNLFQPNRTCRQIETAQRVAVLIDGNDYYRFLHEALRRARRSVFIIGWDIHSEVRLIRNGEGGGYPAPLGALLDALAKKRDDLTVYLLSWDFAMIYAMEREFFPRYKLKWQTHKRVHFALDGRHPVGASHHQKIVVIDDALACVGGLDLTQNRWDTSDHCPEDKRRVDPRGRSYPPFHDVQMAVDGDAARALGALVRERWERSEGSPPAAYPPRDGGERLDPWPAEWKADFENVAVALARTLPEHEDQAPAAEVRQLYLDSIAAARRYIYVENQYLSAHCIGQALAARLEEDEGPDVVIVMPEKTGGWLEQHTMDVLRGRLVQRLRAADRHDRLRLYYPRLSASPQRGLMVHAKVTIIDDRFLRVGSSNLSNRSMGLDSECDLALAAGSQDDDLQKGIAGVLNRLLGEHMGCSTKAVERAREDHGSLIAAIASLREGERTLATLSCDTPEEVDEWVPESELLDPEKPVPPDKLLNLFIEPDQQTAAFGHAAKGVILLALVAGLAVLWRWTPLGDWVDLASAQALAVWIQEQPLAPLLVAAVYVIGGLAALPITLMIVATVLVFGSWMGLLYALGGAWLNAMVLFAIGRWMGRDVVRRFAGSLLNRLSRKLSESGLWAVITFRIVPVAPFSIINLVAGVSEIRWRDYALGTVFGMLPGIVAIVLLADRLSESLRHPDLLQISLLIGSILLVGLGLVALRRWVKGKRSSQSS